MNWITAHLMALAAGFLLDLIFGDPRWMPHPVRAIGALISALEKCLRMAFPKSQRGEFIAGIVLVILICTIPTAITLGIIGACGLISPYLSFAVQVFFSYQLLATRALRDESMKVYHSLKSYDFEGARYFVSMIVGRDTDCLDEKGIVKATVETVAENASDGVIAPLIFMAAGGVPLGLLYKAANTMDSMVGYKNDEYLYFGRAAAIWDDILNFIPARLSGLIMCAGAAISGLDTKAAFRIFLRDRKNHKSPNSAHTEAACAGALGIQLAGGSYYFGKLVQKPTIGDAMREVETEDIPKSCRLMYAAAIISLLIFCVLPLVFALLAG